MEAESEEKNTFCLYFLLTVTCSLFFTFWFEWHTECQMFLPFSAYLLNISCKALALHSSLKNPFSNIKCNSVKIDLFVLVVCNMGRWHGCRKLATAELWSGPSNEKKNIFCKTVYYALCEVSRAFNLHQSSLETERNLNGALIKTLLFY